MKIGILVDGFVLPAWQRLAIERLRAAPCADVVLVVGPASAGPERRAQLGPTARLLERWALRSEHSAPDAFAPVTIASAIEGVARLEAERRPVTGGAAEYSAADVEHISRHGLDVLVDLGSTPLRGEVLSSARSGVWWYGPASEPAGFFEVTEGLPELRAALVVVTPEGRKTLYESASSVERTSLAVSRNRAYWKAASFAARTLEALARDGAHAFGQRVAALPPAPPTRRTASAATFAAFLGRRFMARARARVLEKVSREQWLLLYAFGAAPPEDFGTFKQLAPPPDRFWADPFVVVRDGRYYVFFEEYLYSTHRAHLAVLELDANGLVGAPVRIIERPYHLSYPHLFEFGGELYLIPESKGNRTIEVYRCKKFPHGWELATVLMDGIEAVDATLLEHGGRWWLFANVVENAGSSSWDELCLFSADSPLSRHWTPHPLNPVVSDVKRSRPAGPIFRRDGRLYRPSQDSARCYGYGFHINEITELTPTRYSERIVRSVEPNWDPVIYATHTFTSEDGLTVIDGMRRIWRRS